MEEDLILTFLSRIYVIEEDNKIFSLADLLDHFYSIDVLTDKIDNKRRIVDFVISNIDNPSKVYAETYFTSYIDLNERANITTFKVKEEYNYRENGIPSENNPIISKVYLENKNDLFFLTKEYEKSSISNYIYHDTFEIVNDEKKWLVHKATGINEIGLVNQEYDYTDGLTNVEMFMSVDNFKKQFTSEKVNKKLKEK